MTRVVPSAIQITVAYVLGILLGAFREFRVDLLLELFVILFVLLAFFWWWGKNKPFRENGFQVIALSTFFVLGILVFQLHQPITQPSHYTKSIQTNQKGYLQLKIKERLKPDWYSEKFLAKVLAVNEKPTSGTVLLHIDKDSTISFPETDTVLLLHTTVRKIPEPKNPYGFNYSNYMESQGIYHQLQIEHSDILAFQSGSPSLRGMASNIQNRIAVKLSPHFENKAELELLQALLLGQRQGLSKTVYEQFAAAGVVHILAISGLHVGILLLVFRGIFYPLTRLPHGKSLQTFLTVLALWGYALLAGLSPSVLRAVTMFSFVAVAMLSNRQHHVYNSLLASAFLLLLIDPNLLFQVGFQMSYLAVFFIVWLQPKFYNLYSPKTFFDKKAWEILTVTFAAQLGVAPLSVYYFHQFPLLFFVSNLLILPVLGIILGGGLLVIFLAVFDILPAYILEPYAHLLELLLKGIGWIAAQDRFFLENIPMDRGVMVGFYLLLIAAALYWQKKHYRYLVFTFLSIVIVQSAFVWKKGSTHFSELIVFHKSKSTLLGIKEHQNFQLFTPLDSTIAVKESSINDYTLAHALSKPELDSIPTIFSFQDRTILVVDSLGVYDIKNTAVHTVLLRDSPKLHLSRLIDSLQPKQVLADGSNYTSYVKRWRETCQKENIPFHHTGTEGAYTITDR